MLRIATLNVHSSTFVDGERLPQSMVFKGMGHNGENRSPHLAWSDAPVGTKSFALECHDPDAPTGVGFTHWVLFDIPANVSELAEHADADRLPHGVKKGLNDMGVSGYMGPAPPPGSPHHYIFTVYALDVPTLGLGETTTLALLRFVVRDKKLAEGRLTGLYGVEASR